MEKVNYAAHVITLACVSVLIYMTLDALITLKQLQQNLKQIECIPVEVQLIEGMKGDYNGNL